MKNIISLFIFALIVGFGYTAYRTPYSKCDTPQTYKIGSIDPKFGLTKNELLKDTQSAANILTDAYGKDLFLYSEDGSIYINFVYDARTELEQNISRQQSQIDTQNSSLQERIDQYSSEVETFKVKLADFNAKVEKYNKEGGVTPEIYNQLINEQNQLKAQGDILNERAKQLNLETYNYNSQVDDLNQNVTAFNNAISQKPEEGLYDGNTNTITIYFVDNKSELVHTLAHEFGHALGMLHVENPKSIMYPLSSRSLKFTIEDKTELKIVCQSISLLEHWVNIYLINLNNLIPKLMVFK